MRFDHEAVVRVVAVLVLESAFIADLRSARSRGFPRRTLLSRGECQGSVLASAGLVQMLAPCGNARCDLRHNGHTFETLEAFRSSPRRRSGRRPCSGGTVNGGESRPGAESSAARKLPKPTGNVASESKSDDLPAAFGCVRTSAALLSGKKPIRLAPHVLPLRAFFCEPVSPALVVAGSMASNRSGLRSRVAWISASRRSR